jgi:mono/diheme cytochrome c family protein
MGRHAAHHGDRNNAGRKLPGGYAGAILLALIPPLWRAVMDRRLSRPDRRVHPRQARWLCALAVGTASLALAGCGASRLPPISAETPPSPTDPDAVRRGAYLVAAANCIGCHTDKKHYGKPFAGGGEVPTDFGVYYSRNITPDRAHGIGSWSDDAFLRALRRGISPSGDYYFPAFPYTAFTGMTDRDILDIKAYLMTQPAASTQNKKPAVPFPYNFRPGLALWRALYFKPGPLKPDADKSSAWNRGNYLVNAVAHCGECHSPRNKLGAIDNARRFAGGKLATASGKPEPNYATRAPNITTDLTDGIGTWTTADIVQLLKLGMKHNGDFVAAPMSEVVEGTSKLTDADRAAIATYLKSLAPLRGRGG